MIYTLLNSKQKIFAKKKSKQKKKENGEMGDEENTLGPGYLHWRWRNSSLF